MAPDPVEKQPSDQPPTKLGGGYKSPEEALEKLSAWFTDWSKRLADSSLQLSYAVVAANWALFGSVDKLLNVPAAKLSIGLVVSFLAVNLGLTRLVAELLRRQYFAAERDPARWVTEFEATRGKDDPWPSTRVIDGFSWLLREARTWLPLAAGAAFVAALL